MPHRRFSFRDVTYIAGLTHASSGDPTTVSLGTPTFRYLAFDQPAGTYVNGSSIITRPTSTWGVGGNTGSSVRNSTGMLLGGPGTRNFNGPATAPSPPLSLFFVFGMGANDNRYQTIYTDTNQKGWWVRNMRLGYFSTADGVGPLMTTNVMYDYEIILSSPSYGITMYKDGVNAGLVGLSAQATNYNTIGGDVSGEELNGYLNEVCIWSGSLTAADVAILHAYRQATYAATF